MNSQKNSGPQVLFGLDYRCDTLNCVKLIEYHLFVNLAALLGDENGLTQVGFQTPRKRRSMLLKAQESASKFSPMKDEERKTPKKTPCRKDTENVPGTPRNRRVSIGGEIGATPSKGVNTPTKSALKRNEKLQEATPRSLGKSKRPIEMTPCSQRMLEPVAKTPRQVRTRTRARKLIAEQVFMVKCF